MADELLITTSHGFRGVGDGRAGVDWTVTSLSGWFERGGVRQERSPRPWGDGNFSAPSFRDAKMPAFEGLCVTDESGFDQHRALQALEAALGNGSMTRLTVQGPTGVTWADAQLESEPTFRLERYGTVLAYRATMYVPSGYRYGDVNSSGSGQPVVHRGTADATPTFLVTGSMPSGYKITSPYGEFTVLQSLSSGQTHRISFAEGGLVYRNGVLQRGVYGQPRRIWTIPPGAPQGTHTLVPFAGSGSLVVQVPDTF